jgi:hypothetical protein
VLNSSSALDNIIGNLTNNGTVDFTGALHQLPVTGSYTQGSLGILDIRLDNGTPPATSPSDVLAIGGSATLNGTLNLSAQNSLTDDQTWFPLTYGSNPGPTDFNTVNFPDGNPNWIEIPQGARVRVDN